MIFGVVHERVLGYNVRGCACLLLCILRLQEDVDD